jgi:glycosyltransferase involved in cell wall biosynthesis
MNIFFITNLDGNKKGGVFYATYERLLRHKKKMGKITVVNNNYYDTNLANKIKKKIFPTRNSYNKKKEIYKYNNLKIYNLNYKRNIIYYLKRMFTGELFENIIKDYRNKFDNKLSECDAIHAHWGWPNGYIAYKLSELYSKSFFITFHGSDINFLNKKYYTQMREAMNNAQTCFYVSNNLYDNSKKIKHECKNNYVIYNGIDLDKFNIVNTEKKIKTVGYIGALEYVKGADVLLEIFDKINYKYKGQVKFIIIGDGSLSNKILNEYNNEFPYLNLEIKGFVEHNLINNHLNILDLLIVPSKEEGLSMVTIEAYACGVPVVASNIGGIPEIIKNQKYLIDSSNNFVDNFSDRCVEILNNKVNKSELRNKVKKRFSWEKIVENEFEVYNKYI